MKGNTTPQAKNKGQTFPDNQLLVNRYYEDDYEFVKSSLRSSFCYLDNEDEKFIVPAYCNQVATAATNILISQMINNLHKYEVRARKMTPNKAKSKRRLVVGLKETLKHAQSGHLKLIIIPLDVGRNIQDSSEWKLLKDTAKDMSIPLIFGLTMMELTSSLNRGGCSTSVIGVLNVDGAHQEFQQLCSISIDSALNWTKQALNVFISASENLEESSILRVFSYYGHVSVIKAIDLAKIKKCVNMPDMKSGMTALMLACFRGESEIVEIFLKNGGDPKITDFGLCNSFHYASMSRCWKTIKILLGHYEEDQLAGILSIKEANGYDILQKAVSYKSDLIVENIFLYYGQLQTSHLLIVLNQEHPSEKIFCKFLTKIETLSDPDMTKVISVCAKTGELPCLRQFLAWLKNDQKLSLEKVKSLVDTPIEGCTSCWWASYAGFVGVARELIRFGADAEFEFTLNNRTVTVNQLLEKWKNASSRKL